MENCLTCINLDERKEGLFNTTYGRCLRLFRKEFILNLYVDNIYMLMEIKYILELIIQAENFLKQDALYILKENSMNNLLEDLKQRTRERDLLATVLNEETNSAPCYLVQWKNCPEEYNINCSPDQEEDFTQCWINYAIATSK